MKRIAKFHKVSTGAVCKGTGKIHSRQRMIKKYSDTYEKISLACKRATAGSAGYDFFAPADLVTASGRDEPRFQRESVCEMEQDWVLKCYPRSGLGFKFQICS